jgi:hypothetical protein
MVLCKRGGDITSFDGTQKSQIQETALSESRNGTPFCSAGTGVMGGMIVRTAMTNPISRAEQRPAKVNQEFLSNTEYSIPHISYCLELIS